MRVIHLFFLYFILIESFGQASYDRNKKLKMWLLDDALAVRTTDKKVVLKVTLKNVSDSSLILYGFKDISRGANDEYSLGVLTQNDWVSENAIFIKDGKGKSYTMGIVDVIMRHFGKPIPADTILACETEKKIVVNAHDSIRVNLPIELDPNDPRALRKGSYSMFLLYNCGKNIYNVVDSTIVRGDEARFKAFLFQGYVKSNTIRLVVK